MKKKLESLACPFFLIAVVLLLLNDFIFKNYFHNPVTGKLSDFSGLFAFSFFLMALFPERREIISFLVVVFFIFWKSALSQPLIDAWNSMNLYPVGRTVDYSDLLVLPVVLLAYKYSLRERKIILKKYLPLPLSLLALFSFSATSYLHVYEIGKSYEIAMPKEEIVKKLNNICGQCENFIPVSSHTEKADTTFIDYDTDTVSYSFTGYSHYNDTMWNYDKEGKRIDIDTIYHYTYINKDTMFLSPSGFFIIYFDVKEYLDLTPEQYCGCVEARCRLRSKGDKSEFTVISVDTDPCTYIKPGDKGKEQLIDALEELIVKKLSS